MNTTILILGFIETLICIICFFFKKQEHFLICLLTYNAILLIQYLLQSYYVEVGIISIDIIKSIIFYIYAKKNLKPNLYVIIIFEVILVTISILMWENWASIFLLISSMLGTFAHWQKNMLFLRICCIISSILLIFNYYFTALYSTILAEAITFVSAIISIVIYHIIPYVKNKNSKKIEIDNLKVAIQTNSNKESKS